MSLTIAARRPDEILGPIGAGRMANGYHARELRDT